MKKLDLNIFIYECDATELHQADKNLLQIAQRACATAYAPYSKFYVGAAILLENGTVISGSNQENAAYPSGLCAERTAIFAAASNYADQVIKTIAISAHPADNATFLPITPCGACRQVILEYENKQQQPIRLLMQGPTNKIYIIPSVSTLLPLQFTTDSLTNENK